MRFNRRANQTCKNIASIAIPSTLQMPVFDGASLQCSFLAYRVSGILMHTGHTPQAGHYTARLLPLSGQDTGITQWSTDDGRTARPMFRAVEHDPQVLVQGYILLRAGELAGEGTEPRGTFSLETLHSRVKNSAICLMCNYATTVTCALTT